MKTITSILMVLFCSISFAQQLSIQTFATGFSNPVNIKNAGDSRLFVVEQAGLIQIVSSDGSKNNTPFLDINSIVSNSGGERGLLGLAFHPDYTTNGYFYINYINNSGNTVISRFKRSSSDPDIADDTSELQLLTITQPFSNHNGGEMAFGAEGYLYISSGDGGSGGDPQNRAQSLSTLLGKLLRIDVDGTSNGNYGIPADNPFVESENAMQEIWAYGLRNAWKFSFDRDTDALWIADVGQNNREEINLADLSQAGLNYGWRCYEGSAPFNQSSDCPPSSNLTFPIAEYTHSGNGLSKCSITGGYRYRGTNYPNFEGLYFFADFCSNEIGVLTESGDTWDVTFSQPFGGNGWTTFGEDNNGELYIAGIQSGTVYRIVDNNLGIIENDPFKVTLSPNPATNDIYLNVPNPSIIIQNIDIYNLQGKLISSYAEFKSQIITLSIKDLASGMYYVKITNKEGSNITKKLIKN